MIKTVRPRTFLSRARKGHNESVNPTAFILLLCVTACGVLGAERQLTSTPVHHALDNNDNFSKDDRYLCFDIRDTLGPGPANSTRILKVDVASGAESILYAPRPVLVSTTESAPGLVAASFSPVADEVIFIHGPMVSEIPVRGAYARTNRLGATVPGDGSGRVTFLDARDVTSETTPPGAHRGGTHRHEYSRDGKRIGFTYDDHLLSKYGRNLGMMVRHPKAPRGGTHWTVLLVPIVPAGTAKPGDIEHAADDSWIGEHGLMRAFVGKVRETNGAYASALFVVDIPAEVDVTTANAGTRERYPTAPKGVKVRRLTATAAQGIVRGSPDGKRIAYYDRAADGARQVFLISPLGKERPVQATSLPGGVTSGLRWHPTGNSIAAISGHGIVVTCVQAGPLFGVSHYLTSHGPDLPPAEALVWSHDGRTLAFNRRVPIHDAAGKRQADFAGRDFRQIFLADFPDSNGNGIADPIEAKPASR